MRGRSGLQCRQDLRYRGVVAGTAEVSRDLLLLQHGRLPGPPHDGALAQSGNRQAGAGAHAERLRAGGGPDLGGRGGKLPEGGRNSYNFV